MFNLFPPLLLILADSSSVFSSKGAALSKFADALKVGSTLQQPLSDND